jgi:histidinol phosphatase-like PHP family hydrolase
MHPLFSRRDFLARSAVVTCACAATAHAAVDAPVIDLNSPLVDLHAHLDNSTLEDVLRLSAERNVTFGIVEHAGTKENQYPVVLSNDAELENYLAMLEGKPVYKGIQAEWVDWMGCFSRDVLARLDYVLTDMMTWPGVDGQRQKMWEPGLDIGNPETFMDRYVDWYVENMERMPIDILANVSWLPAPFATDYDAQWSEPRVARVVEAAVQYGIAIEISSGFELPKRAWLEQAKAAGVKFTFGSNGRYPKMGLLDYSLNMARELGLTHADLFTPAPDGQKAVQRRMG